MTVKPKKITRITFITGLILLGLLGSVIIVILALAPSFQGAIVERGFTNLLAEYDFRYKQLLESGRTSFQYQELENLSQELDLLETRASRSESWLSILKRRKQLVKIDSSHISGYRQSSQRALLAFPYSQQIAAVAASALLDNAAVTPETEKQLREILPAFSDAQLLPVSLALHVLLDDFQSPQKAYENLPLINMTDIIDITPAHETETILINLAILQILKGDVRTAKTDITTARLLFPPTPALISLAAEYFYDFDDPRQSAELFSMLQDKAYSMRQADALWLAGDFDPVRNIWKEIAELPSESDIEPALLFRSLYNLALTSQIREEKISLLERLIEEAGGENDFMKYGLIHYSRLQDFEDALLMLEDEAEKKKKSGLAGGFADVLIELEAVKRKAERGEAARIIAETWLLLGRFPNTEELYHWGAWYFQLQRNSLESQLLFDTAKRQNLKGDGLAIHEALQHLYEGRLDAAETMLSETGNWAAAANLGRIKEHQREPSRAIEIYKDALIYLEKDGELSPYKKNIASKIWFRIASCQKLLHRADESRESLRQALEMNPDNLNAILELNN